MPKNITDSLVWTTPVQGIQDGDHLNSANLADVGIQDLANRTAYLRGSHKIAALGFDTENGAGTALTAGGGYSTLPLSVTLAGGLTNDVLLAIAVFKFGDADGLSFGGTLDARLIRDTVTISGSEIRRVAVGGSADGESLTLLGAYTLLADDSSIVVGAEAQATTENSTACTIGTMVALLLRPTS